MSDFETGLKQIADEYEPIIKAARSHLFEMEDAYRRRKHVHAVECGYTNAIIELIRNGVRVAWDSEQEVVYVGESREPHFSSDPLGADFEMARQLQLIVSGDLEYDSEFVYNLAVED